MWVGGVGVVWVGGVGSRGKGGRPGTTTVSRDCSCDSLTGVCLTLVAGVVDADCSVFVSSSFTVAFFWALSNVSMIQ